MARQATCGVMLWDAKSKGTLNNIQNLVGMGKRTPVYFAPEKVFLKLSSERDLRELLQRCDSAKLEEAQRRIKSAVPARNQISLLK